MSTCARRSATLILVGFVLLALGHRRAHAEEGQADAATLAGLKQRVKDLESLVHELDNTIREVRSNLVRQEEMRTNADVGALKELQRVYEALRRDDAALSERINSLSRETTATGDDETDSDEVDRSEGSNGAVSLASDSGSVDRAHRIAETLARIAQIRSEFVNDHDVSDEGEWTDEDGDLLFGNQVALQRAAKAMDDLLRTVSTSVGVMQEAATKAEQRRLLVEASRDEALAARIGVSAQAAQAQLESADEEATHRRETFAWQRTSTVFIFVVMQLFLLVSIVIAILEFRRAAKLGVPEENTELSASATSLSVSTRRTGALLLVGAMALYFLYMKFVYPITSIP